MESRKSSRPKSHGTAEQNLSLSRRFEEACEIMKKNAARFIKDDLLSESSSEDELDDSAIMEKTFSQYSEDGNLNLLRTREFLQDIITSGAVVCLICIESVKRNHEIWSCQNCFCIFHLHCIQKWAKDSLYYGSTLEENKKAEASKWCCPKCRHDYAPSQKPLKYFCFCGKVENPSLDSWNVPHSCGQSCNKRLKPDCSHTCCLLCHPGPCPPCPQTVLASCCCSKSKGVPRRCSNKEWSCVEKCDKLLSCNLHFCDEFCHKGECLPCKRQKEQKCQCGSETTLRPCSNPDWQCGKICNKLLECKNHLCEVICHKGPCLKCPNSGTRHCPCGKQSMTLPCTENVLTCGDTCNKLLECGMHKCAQRCHFGECGKCLQMCVMKCRCGQREKSLRCCKEFTCDIKCKRRRDCGKHYCNKKCCTGSCPPCDVLCGRSLNCGKHKCASVCHPGPCYPCREVVKITCNCGAAEVTVPCGRKKAAVPPRCSTDCKLPPVCHHPNRHKHQCHFGSCPPCRLVCGNRLGCGHICPVRCHSAVLTKVEIKEKKDGPWDLLNSYKMELVCKPCPPCLVPIPVTCLGGHEVQSLPCSEAKPTSCGRQCGRLLSCKNHTCSLECHDADVSVGFMVPSAKCETCDELCEKPRKPGCRHPCMRSCHPEECSPCLQFIKMKCHCKINTLYVACSDWCNTDDTKRAELMSCSNRCPKDMSCGHRCVLPCHTGPCSNRENCKKKIVLRCPCKVKKREVQCLSQAKKNTVLQCDKECIDFQEALRALELEQILENQNEERKRHAEELKEYMKKTEGKKRRKKKHHSDDETDYKTITINVLAITACIACVSGLFLFYFLSFYNHL